MFQILGLTIFKDTEMKRIVINFLEAKLHLYPRFLVTLHTSFSGKLISHAQKLFPCWQEVIAPFKGQRLAVSGLQVVLCWPCCKITVLASKYVCT